MKSQPSKKRFATYKGKGYELSIPGVEPQDDKWGESTMANTMGEVQVIVQKITDFLPKSADADNADDQPTVKPPSH